MAAANFLHRHGKSLVTSKRSYHLVAKKYFASHRMGNGQIFVVFSATFA